jgi:hypothetical protein
MTEATKNHHIKSRFHCKGGLNQMEFKKVNNHYNIIVNNEIVGTMYKDTTQNHNYCIIAKLNFLIQGYVNQKAGKTYKQVKRDIERLYYNLLDMSKKHNKQIIRH